MVIDGQEHSVGNDAKHDEEFEHFVLHNLKIITTLLEDSSNR